MVECKKEIEKSISDIDIKDTINSINIYDIESHDITEIEKIASDAETVFKYFDHIKEKLKT